MQGCVILVKILKSLKVQDFNKFTLYTECLVVLFNIFDLQNKFKHVLGQICPFLYQHHEYFYLSLNADWFLLPMPQ